MTGARLEHPMKVPPAALLGLATLLVLLFTSCSDPAPSRITPIATPVTPYSGPIAAYAVEKLDPEPLSGLYLKAIDPLTGEAIEGREPVELGHHGTWALSPDGRTMALAWSPTGNDSGPDRLFLLDLNRWEKTDLGFEALISKLFWSPDGDRLHLTTWHRCSQPECIDSSSELVTVDSATGNVLSESSLPFSSYATRLSPDGYTLYLFGAESTNLQSKGEGQAPRLVAFDVQRGRVRAELELPEGLWWTRVETDEHGEYSAQYLPGTAVSPDGRSYYVVHPDEDRITVVDLESMQVERSEEIGHNASLFGRLLSLLASTAHAKGGATTSKGAAVSPDGRLLYITGSTERPVRETADAEERTWESIDYGLKDIDTASLEVVAEDVPPSAPSGSHLNWAVMYREVAPDPSGRYLYALRGAELFIMDPTTLEVIETAIAPFYDFLVGPAPSGATGTNLTGKIAFTSRRDGKWETYVINADGSDQTRVANNPATDYGPTWSPDGTRIAFTSRREGDAEIYVVHEDGSGLTNLTNKPADDRGPTWSPDGSRLAFVSDRDGSEANYVLDVEASTLTALTDRGTFPAWSPDGSRIAFQSRSDSTLPDDDYDIYIASADGTSLKRVTDSPDHELYPVWSPDGSRIMFTSLTRTTSSISDSEIYVMNADGSGLTNLTTSSAWDVGPAWSPDGTQIVFGSARRFIWGVYVMNADGTGITKLVDELNAKEIYPAWSPDGASIAFVSAHEGNSALYVMNADGSVLTRLTDSFIGVLSIAWAPAP